MLAGTLTFQNLVDDYLVIDQITKSKSENGNESTQFVNNTTPLSNADVADMAVDAKELDDNSLAYQTNSTARTCRSMTYVQEP